MNMMECDVDHIHYWVMSTGLGDSLAKNILATAKREGRCPMGIGDLALEMINQCETWCAANCKGAYRVDPAYRLEMWFTDPKDAMLFKLTFG